MKAESFDVAVVGGGPAGYTAAILCALEGFDTAFFTGAEDVRTRTDARTTALMQGAVRLLGNIGVWDGLMRDCAPLRRLKLIDDTDWSVKAPAVLFDSAELGDDPFGWNVPNLALLSALSSACVQFGNLHLFCQNVASLSVDGLDAVLTGDEGTRVSAHLVVAADGRKSLCREVAGIKTTTWSYPQTAIACSFEHALPHNDMSIEFHKPAGPLTLVPLPGNRSSLVWVGTPEKAFELTECTSAEFEARLTDETQGVLGAISDSSPRGAFPIKGLTARTFAQNRVALIGEAAHVLPPIGAQGLNLGLRDAALISELAGNARAMGRDIADDRTLGEYDRRRRLDVLPRTALVDFLNRSLFSGLMPLQGLRGLGLFLLDTVGPLRRMVMRQGIEPQSNLPQIMQRRVA